MPYKDRQSKEAKESAKRSNQKFRIKVKIAVFEHYGNKCNCCGETTPKFLTIDHINNDGNRHRKLTGRDTGSGMYTWIVSNNFPEYLQILCWNCNCGKSQNNGICPHKDYGTD